MIAHIKGVVSEKFGSSIIIDVGGVGYELIVPTTDFVNAVLDSTVKFYTYHHVREQSEDLYGFSTLAAKKIFELLITVQSVGPKAAIAILSLGDAERVRNAIANSDTEFIKQATGIGKKTAERVTLDLSDKVGLPAYYQKTEVQTELSTNDEALEALMALGFTLADATKALVGVDSRGSTSVRVREALKNKN